MHRPTRLDTQQSECQNSLQHTFFSPRSPNIMLKKGNLNPLLPIHYFIVMKAPKKEGGNHAEEVMQEAVRVGETWQKGGVDELRRSKTQAPSKCMTFAKAIFTSTDLPNNVFDIKNKLS